MASPTKSPEKKKSKKSSERKISSKTAAEKHSSKRMLQVSATSGGRNTGKKNILPCLLKLSLIFR